MKTEKRARDFPRGILMICLDVTLACLILLVAGCKKKDETPTDKEPVVVSVISVSEGSIEDVLRFTGDVRARRDVRLLSQVGERIVDLRFDKATV